MANTIQNDAFPNTTVHYTARKIGRGYFAGYYSSHVRTVERSAWLAPCVSDWRGDVISGTRADALAWAEKAALEAAPQQLNR